MNDDYRKALKLAQRYSGRMLSEGKDPYLPSLEDITDTVGLRSEPLGAFEVPAGLFVGTRDRGRQNAFAGNFLPLLSEGTEFAYNGPPSTIFSSRKGSGTRSSATYTRESSTSRKGTSASPC